MLTNLFMTSITLVVFGSLGMASITYTGTSECKYSIANRAEAAGSWPLQTNHYSMCLVYWLWLAAHTGLVAMLRK